MNSIPIVWMNGTLGNGEEDYAFALAFTGTCTVGPVDHDLNEVGAMCDCLAAAEDGHNASGQNWANAADASDVIADRFGNLWPDESRAEAAAEAAHDFQMA
jgi:hypothetical protein